MKIRDILRRQCLTGIFFALWGVLWLALYYENLFGKLLSGFFIIFGIFIFVKNYTKLKKGNYEDILIDERMELNMLRASKKGFVFMLEATGFLLLLFAIRIINEILFVALMGPVFAIASVLYVWTYHNMRRGQMKNRIKELRARYDMTQEELARKVGVRRETIVFLEKGKYNPSLKLAYDISKILHSRIEEVFLFED